MQQIWPVGPLLSTRCSSGRPPAPSPQQQPQPHHHHHRRRRRCRRRPPPHHHLHRRHRHSHRHRHGRHHHVEPAENGMNWKKFKASNTLQDAQVVNLRALFEKPVLCLGVRAVSTNSLRGVWMTAVSISCRHLRCFSSAESRSLVGKQ